MEDAAVQALEAEKGTPKKELTEGQRSDLKLSRCGRKPLFRRVMLSEGFILGVRGFTMEQIAQFWHVNRRTLYKWCDRHPELRTEIERGKIQADEKVIKALFDSALAGNVTAQIFWLKNRRPAQWRDVKKSADSGVGGDTRRHTDRRIFFSAFPDDDPDGSRGLHAGEGR